MMPCRGGHGKHHLPCNRPPLTPPGTGTSWPGQWWWATTSWASRERASGQCPSGASCLTLRSVEVGTIPTSLYMPRGPTPTSPHRHPHISFQFNPKTFHGDLALLELAVPLAPSPTVSPVCLPAGSAEPSPGTPCYIAGWGSLYEGKRLRGVFPSVPSLVPTPARGDRAGGCKREGDVRAQGTP